MVILEILPLLESFLSEKIEKESDYFLFLVHANVSDLLFYQPMPNMTQGASFDFILAI